MKQPFALLSLFLSLVVAGCTSATDAASGTAPAQAPNGTAPVTIRFSCERDDFASSVDSIVYTDQFRVRLAGLPARAEVAVTATSYSPREKNRGYVAEAKFVADADGRIDTGTSASLGGTFEGVDPDAFVWSGVERPVNEGLGPERTSMYFEAKIGDEVVATASLGRTVSAANVKVEPVTEGGLVGELIVPAGATDRIPIVAFGGSEGGLFGGELYGQRLASWGYPVLALAYFGEQGVPSDLTDIPLEYFEKAFAYLDARSEVKKGKAIVIGASRGGELALQLGATFPNVVGVVADAPSSYRWPGFGVGAAAWTYGGKPLPFVPESDAVPSVTKTPDGKTAYLLRPVFEQDLAAASPADVAAARIEVEKTQGPILMIGGAEDALWPSCDFIERAKAELDASGHASRYADETVCLSGGGHGIVTLGMPTAGSTVTSIGGRRYALGGTAAANAHASRERDKRLRTFLERITK